MRRPSPEGKNGMIAVKLHAAYTRAGEAEEAEARLAQWLKESPMMSSHGRMSRKRA